MEIIPKKSSRVEIRGVIKVLRRLIKKIKEVIEKMDKEYQKANNEMAALREEKIEKGEWTEDDELVWTMYQWRMTTNSWHYLYP